MVKATQSMFVCKNTIWRFHWCSAGYRTTQDSEQVQRVKNCVNNNALLQNIILWDPWRVSKHFWALLIWHVWGPTQLDTSVNAAHNRVKSEQILVTSDVVCTGLLMTGWSWGLQTGAVRQGAGLPRTIVVEGDEAEETGPGLGPEAGWGSWLCWMKAAASGVSCLRAGRLLCNNTGRKP